MNDFEKEELQTLIECIDAHNASSTMGEYTLRLKIIRMIEELEKLEPKYKVGDTVYFRHESDFIAELKVTTITWYEHNNQYGYLYHGVPYYEEFLFPTRQALIEHQLQYWSKLYEEANPGRLCFINCLNETDATLTNEGTKPCHHEYQKGICIYCGDEDIFGGTFSKPECDHTLDPDNRICMKCHEYVPKVECEHKTHIRMPILGGGTISRCIKCGEFYR